MVDKLKFIKMRREGVQQHDLQLPDAYQAVDSMPKRKTAPILDATIPDTSFLSGTAKQIIRRVTGYLEKNYPVGRKIKYYPITSSSKLKLKDRPDLKELFKDWSITEENEKIDVADNYAAHHRITRNIMLSRDLLDDLESPYYFRRMRGVRGIIHEYWHALRINPSRLLLDRIEEATADYFARKVLYELTGYYLSGKELRYYEYLDEFDKILPYIGPRNTWNIWIMTSRQADDTEVWLKQSLAERGLSLAQVESLTYNLVTRP